jgi:hypothetical protein
MFLISDICTVLSIIKNITGFFFIINKCVLLKILYILQPRLIISLVRINEYTKIMLFLVW